MYYPIIDKLKTLMTDIASVKSKEPLIIEGTLTSATSGSWQGTYLDILNALSTKRPVYFYLHMSTTHILVPIMIGNLLVATSGYLPYSVADTTYKAYGILSSNNTFTLSMEV